MEDLDSRQLLYAFIYLKLLALVSLLDSLDVCLIAAGIVIAVRRAFPLDDETWFTEAGHAVYESSPRDWRTIDKEASSCFFSATHTKGKSHASFGLGLVHLHGTFRFDGVSFFGGLGSLEGWSAVPCRSTVRRRGRLAVDSLVGAYRSRPGSSAEPALHIQPPPHGPLFG